MFACFTLMVMVSFKGSFVVCLFYLMVMVSFKGSFVFCLFYLDGYGVVQGIFCCLLVFPLWLWCRSRDLLLFVCFILMFMVLFKASFLIYIDFFSFLHHHLCIVPNVAYFSGLFFIDCPIGVL